MYNLFFYYKNYNRYIFILKHSASKYHFMNLLKMEKIVAYFNIQNLTELDNTTILSSLFFFKYYFGVIPYFKNYMYQFKLNVGYYTFTLEYTFIKKYMYSVYYFFLNDVYHMINKIYLKCTKHKNYWEFKVDDMNFFIEKKNTLGFFFLKHKLFLQLYYKNNLNWDYNIFDTYKIKWI